MKIHPPLFFFTVVSWLVMAVAPAVLAAELAPFTPAADEQGRWGFHAEASLPNVLILGDSISIGYTRAVRGLLTGQANVYRPMMPNGKQPVNCGDTRIGLKDLEGWLGTQHWDVIHFNWGLWDLCYRNPAVKTQGNRDKVNGTLSVSPEDYARNLELLVTRLKKTGAKLIWASTTVVPEGDAGRFVGDDAKYNAVAAEVMKRHEIPTDDLYVLTKGFGGRFSARPGDVHYTRAGYDEIAKQVAGEIRAALPLDLSVDYEHQLGFSQAPVEK